MVEPDAPPVVLLHGQPGGSEDWALIVPLLEGRTLLAPTRPGYDGGAAQDFFGNARRVLELLDERGCREAVLVGYSWAGGVALATALLAPQRVAALVLVCSVGPGSAVTWSDRLLAGRVFGPGFVWLMRRFGPRLAAGLAWANGSRLGREQLAFLREGLGRIASGPAWPTWLAEQRTLVRQTPELAGRLAAIAAPTVILAAGHDGLVPAKAARDLSEALSESVLVQVDSGHLLPLEAPQEVARAIDLACASARAAKR